MLFAIPLRCISRRNERLAIRMYNVHSLGYALCADNREMLQPEDIPIKKPLCLRSYRFDLAVVLSEQAIPVPTRVGSYYFK